MGQPLRVSQLKPGKSSPQAFVRPRRSRSLNRDHQHGQVGGIRVRRSVIQRGSQPGHVDMLWHGSAAGTKVWDWTVVCENVGVVPQAVFVLQIRQTREGLSYFITGYTGRMKVRCSCPDFYYRHAYDLQRVGSLFGNSVPPPTDTANRRLRPGLCKHLTVALPAINTYLASGQQTVRVQTTRRDLSSPRIQEYVNELTKQEIRESGTPEQYARVAKLLFR